MDIPSEAVDESPSLPSETAIAEEVVATPSEPLVEEVAVAPTDEGATPVVVGDEQVPAETAAVDPMAESAIPETDESAPPAVVPAEIETGDESAIAPALQLADIPDLELSAGATGEFSLADYVVAGAVDELNWSVAGAVALDVSIDAEGRVVVRVPADFSGREVLLFRAENGAGQAVVDVVRVHIPASEPAVATDSESQAEALEPTASAPELPELELVEWPEITLVAGHSDSSLVLAQLVASGDVDAVVWSLRGGVFIAAHIDAQGRLHLDGAQAQQGREIFYLEAQLGTVRQQVRLVVGVEAPQFVLADLPAMRVEDQDATMDLKPYISGDFAPATIAWTAEAPIALGVQIDEGVLRIEGATAGVYEIRLIATAPNGRQREAILRIEVIVVEASANEPVVDSAEPTATPSAEPFEPSAVTESPPVVVEPVEIGELPPVDLRPPGLKLSGHLLAAGAVELRLESDEPLEGMPVFIAAGQVLAVEARDGYYAAVLQPVAGVLQVIAAASDSAGNAAETQFAFSVGRGRTALSPDGRLRIQGRVGAVLLYGDSEGYSVELAQGSTAELVFSGVEPGQGLFRRGAGGWEELPAEIVAGELCAVIDASGVFRVAKGTAASVAVMPVAYPNPFNAEVVLRYLVAVEGPVRVVVYDALGAQIRELVHQVQGVGLRTAIWDGRDQRGLTAASGVYLLAIEMGGERRTRKVMLIR